MSNNRLTKDDRRSAAREKARVARESAAKRTRRNRLLLQGGIGVGILAVLAVVALVIVNIANAGSVANAPRNMASNGVVLQKGLTAVTTPANHKPAEPVVTKTKKNVVQVQTVIDYLCPYCNQFESTNAAFLQQEVNGGRVELEITPVAILTTYGDYSIRAASAAACVADAAPSKFYAFSMLLYKNQPQETNAKGLSNSELAALAGDAGASGADTKSCIMAAKYYRWVQGVTQNTKITGTPTVYIDGQKWNGNPADATGFAAAVKAAEKAKNLT